MTRFLCLFLLAGKSAWNRRGTLALVVCSIALSATLLLGLERIRSQVRESFVQAVSGTDLIVGARGGNLQLMLYAIFHLGGATHNMGFKSAEVIGENPEVAWTIPISLGDSHLGYPVVATNHDFFRHYKFRNQESIAFARGQAFDDLFDVVVGAQVARMLGYDLGHEVALSHGGGDILAIMHDDMPFTVRGVLAPTGTPVDRSLYISLAAMEAIHLGWQGGAPLPGLKISPEQASKLIQEPESITALLVGLERRSRVFALQRDIHDYREEALTAVMPGVAMDQIWQMVNTGEKALLLVSLLVTVTGLAGLVAAILAGLGERRRELTILRSVGARPADILVLLAAEGFLLVVSGILLALFALFLLLNFLSPVLLDLYGIVLDASLPSLTEWGIMGGISVAGFCAALIPAFRAYRLSLSDGLSLSR
ncbi:MAG: ABC transporter permease [Betaproteobacteria bacterium]|nr:ABC transporter permease [Betaproteobacteria bacterium]